MKKGFTLIELLAVIVILAVIALIATPIVLGIISNAKKEAFKDTAYGIIEASRNEYIKEMYSTQTASNVTFTYTDGVESSSVANKSLNYNGAKPSNGTVTLTKNGDVAIAIHDGVNCVYKSYSDNEVTIETKPLSECTADYSVNKQANTPKLAEGMTPIKWNGTAWVSTTVSDKDWYSYDNTNRKWANARTADGSMWVWIPRYIYKIKPLTEGDTNSGWHKATAGIIDIQFSKGTKDDWNSGITLNTTTTANASNNTWTNHPAFTFGDTDLTGIWVAKFEASNNSDEVSIMSTVSSWRNINTSNSFLVCRNMETKTVYGWKVASGLQSNGSFATDANDIDTHLIKNVEWGAVAYLSKSIYGKNTDEIYINNNQNYVTGCAGNTVSEGSYNGCQNTYETENGSKASTTGNIYGIYDLSGGAWERTAAYLDNSDGNLANGSSIVSADLKYKDIHDIEDPDNQSNNYTLSINSKGDAIYETSSDINGAYSWFGDYSYMVNTTGPWFIRSGRYDDTSTSGIFNFNNNDGSAYQSIGFRPVIVSD